MYKKLSNNDEIEIINGYQQGISANKLGKQFGVTCTCITDLLKRNNLKLRDLSEAGRTCTLNEKAFDILTPEVCYWIGFLFADGSLGKGKAKNALTLGLAIKDLGHIEKFKTFLGSSHKIYHSNENRRKTGKPGATALVSLCVRHPNIVDTLKQYGMAGLNSSPVQELVDSIDFWRGVIDGDGSLILSKIKPYVNKPITWNNRKNEARIQLCGGKQLMEDFLIFIKSKVKTKVKVLPAGNIFKISVSGRNAITLIDLLYTNSTISLDRKYKKSRDILQYNVDSLSTLK